ncbi:hypothetical protein VPHD486_0173 [Vibrio phage D486]
MGFFLGLALAKGNGEPEKFRLILVELVVLVKLVVLEILEVN